MKFSVSITFDIPPLRGYFLVYIYKQHFWGFVCISQVGAAKVHGDNGGS